MALTAARFIPPFRDRRSCVASETAAKAAKHIRVTSYTIPACMVQHTDHLLAWYPQPQQQVRRHSHIISHQPLALPSSAIATAVATARATAAFSHH